MSSITQITSEEQEVNSTITKFFKTYQVGNLLRRCNANKEKGVPVMKIFLKILFLHENPVFLHDVDFYTISMLY